MVGDQDLRLTKGQTKSTKHRRAEELIGRGCAIRVVGEGDFMLMVATGESQRHDFDEDNPIPA